MDRVRLISYLVLFLKMVFFFYWGGTQGCREAAVACVGRAGNLMTSSGDELQVGCS